MDRARLPHAILKYQPAGIRDKDVLWRTSGWMKEAGTGQEAFLPDSIMMVMKLRRWSLCNFLRSPLTGL
jgi:hypothetical protein